MGTSNVELYETLKPKIGKDGARMIAEVLPAARDLATRSDIDRLRAAITGLESRMTGLEGRMTGLEGGMTGLEGRFESRIAELETRLLRWTLGFFAPLWAAVLALLVTLFLRG